MEIIRSAMKVPVKEPIEEILINLYWVDQYSAEVSRLRRCRILKSFWSTIKNITSKALVC